MKLISIAFAVLLVVAGVPAPTTAGDDGRPLADAGLDQSTTVGSTVYLDGGGSLDPDGEIEAYDWSIETPGGETVHPRDPDAVTTRFVPEKLGRYEVRLTVTDEDGQSQSDTLYVDVEESNGHPPTPTATETPTETATPGRTPTSEPTATPVGSDLPTPTPSTDTPDLDTNEAPSGQIHGPSAVTSGSSVSYTIDATDPDGEVVDRWWVPGALASSSGRSDLRGSTRTITVDGTPGTIATVEAIVVDDDGATSTLTKAVEVRNALPSASIEGSDTAVVNTTQEYRLVASDPDGQITSVSLVGGSSAVQPVGQLSLGAPTSSGEWARSFRFTEIPEDDGTVTLVATVVDEYGGTTKVVKEVTVVRNSSQSTVFEPINQSAPQILSLDVSLQEGPEGINRRQALFTATASDRDSSRLTFVWEIGDVAVLRNRASGSPAEANISYALEDQHIQARTVEVTLTVRDQNGYQRSMTKTLEIEQADPAGGSVGRGFSVSVTSVMGRTVKGKFRMDRSHAGEIVVLNFGDGQSTTVELGSTAVHAFSHEYGSAGRYSISMSPGWSPDVASVPVNVSHQEYSVFTYERKESTVQRTIGAESPESDWTRDGIDRIDREQVGTESTRTLANGGKGITTPGEEWSRVGTTTEHHTETRTTESVSDPGGDWVISERNVDEKQVFSDWEYTTVPQKGLLNADWKYVERVPRTVGRTETVNSADRPSGDGWSREAHVGRTQVDYRTQWVDYQFHADSDWQYLGADRYVDYYDETTKCVEYVELASTRHCIREETDRDPVYDYRYQYRVPQYDAVYEWERTVQETVYEYKYRSATYTIEDVHEYEKEVRVGTQFVQWERPIIDRTEIYRWKKSEQSWEEASSFSKPAGNYRNLTRVVRECGTAEEEPQICEESS
jgi:hypothetical protein